LKILRENSLDISVHLAKLIARTIYLKQIVACVAEGQKAQELPKRSRKKKNHHLLAPTSSWQVLRGLEIRAQVMVARIVLTPRLKSFAARRASEAMDCGVVSSI